MFECDLTVYAFNFAGIGDSFSKVKVLVCSSSSVTSPKSITPGLTLNTGPWPLHLITQENIGPPPKVITLKKIVN